MSIRDSPPNREEPSHRLFWLERIQNSLRIAKIVEQP
jgi:hypothetical protein